MPSIRTRYLNEGLANTGLNHARRCVICLAGRTGQARPALGLGELCRLHRHRRRDHGHPQIHNGLTAREWRPIVPAVLLYVKASPPSAEVLASVGRLLAPG